ncbi:sensor histidine kinase [Herbiconiux solani]|uniref:sensor histidine kinase n=1 Tax=Herbiconiux solani TaxID=661329 RepID=UPI00082606FB|nr:ATP-binding protein [Herbiconiux solani]
MSTEAGPPLSRPRFSRAQIDSTLARLEGLFGFGFALLSLPVLSASLDTLKPEWAWGVAIVTFGSIAVAFACSLVGRGIRISMALVALLFVLTLLLWPLAVRTPDAALGVQPWLWYIVIVAIGAAGISFPTRWAAVYTVAVPAMFAVLRILPAGGGVGWELAGLDAVYALVLGSFVVIVITTLRTAASQVDAAQTLAARRYADAAKRHATEQERTRVDTVIHDRVLSSLLAAARAATPADRTLAVQMAEQALVALHSADAESDGAADQPVVVLVERLRALSGTLDAEIAFEQEGDLGGVLPARVLEGMYAAAVQAVVNSIRHADPDERPAPAAPAGNVGPADTTAHLDIEDTVPLAPAGPRRVTRSIRMHGWGVAGLTVVIADTGAGFDVDAVPADRLGLRISIRERLSAVGGAAHVRSAPGAGTSVILEWPDEGVHA